MRNLWDEERKTTKVQKKAAVFLKKRRAIGKYGKEGLAKTQKYFLEHLKRKKMVMDFFPDYEKYLNKAGFLKI